MSARNTVARLSLAGLLALVLAGGLAYEIVATRAVRQSIRTYTELITTANRADLSEADRLEALRQLCSSRYLQREELRLAPEGGVVGLPRSINKNFQAWRQGENVWLCPTNRIGPVYQFVEENGRWRFDGLVAILRPGGELVPVSTLPDLKPD
jgi:hypothetical protein